jgi:hypothetical protein
MAFLRFKLEHYLETLPRNLEITFCTFRGLNSDLLIEKGRYFGIKRENRTCSLCNQQKIGDECHHIFKCCYFTHESNEYISNYYSRLPTILNFQALMFNDNRNTFFNLAMFV